MQMQVNNVWSQLLVAQLIKPDNEEWICQVRDGVMGGIGGSTIPWLNSICALLLPNLTQKGTALIDLYIH